MTITREITPQTYEILNKHTEGNESIFTLDVKCVHKFDSNGNHVKTLSVHHMLNIIDLDRYKELYEMIALKIYQDRVIEFETGIKA